MKSPTASQLCNLWFFLFVVGQHVSYVDANPSPETIREAFVEVAKFVGTYLYMHVHGLEWLSGPVAMGLWLYRN